MLVCLKIGTISFVFDFAKCPLCSKHKIQTKMITYSQLRENINWTEKLVTHTTFIRFIGFGSEGFCAHCFSLLFSISFSFFLSCFFISLSLPLSLSNTMMAVGIAVIFDWIRKIIGDSFNTLHNHIH